MNKVILIGRLTKDIKTGVTQSGIQTAQFTLAVNRTYKNKEGNYDADFINCVAFRNTAEFMGKYIKKGNQICVDGSLQTRNYEKDGNKVFITEVLVENVNLLEKKEKTEEPQEIPQNVKTDYDNENTDIQLEDKDLPF